MSKITKFGHKFGNNKDKNLKKIPEIKAYLGFEYIKFKKDVNGLDFCISHLKEYAKDIRYIISVARKVADSTFVYNFFVEGTKLKDFFVAYLDGKIDGEIVEIDKLKPENLA